MGISQFTVHNVLRTYARQDRLGKVQRPKVSARAGAVPTADRVNLSPTAQKVQWVGNLAAALVDRNEPGIDPDARQARIRSTRDELLSRHRDDIADDGVPPQELEARLRALYLD